jgi:hypothetical protein
MASTKKKATAKSRVSFKDLKSKKDPKGGCASGQHLPSMIKFGG